MLKVVSNTTPIISLLKLNKLEILKDLYGQICIPLAVYREIEAGKSKGYYQDLLQVDWILISKVANGQTVTSFPELGCRRGRSHCTGRRNKCRLDYIG